MIKESISKKISQEDLDLVQQWKHHATLYGKLKEEKSFFLKIELPGYKISEVVSQDVEDIITGSTLEAFKNLVKNLRSDLELTEAMSQKQEQLTSRLESENKTIGSELIKVQNELKILKGRNFWQRLLNK